MLTMIPFYIPLKLALLDKIIKEIRLPYIQEQRNRIAYNRSLDKIISLGQDLSWDRVYNISRIMK